MQNNKEEGFFNQIWYKFYPYWPLFILFFILAVLLAFLYTKSVTPLYEAAASILVKDERKGADDSKISTSLDYLSSKKIIENEIEVLRSKTLLKDVVIDLCLYAPIYEEGRFAPSLAYSTSPISVIAESPESIYETKSTYFKYDSISKKVVINKKAYPLNEWTQINKNILKFVLNASYTTSSNKNLYFSLLDVRKVTMSLLNTLDVVSVSKLSSVVVLKIKDPSPVRAENILNGLIRKYFQLSSNEKANLATNTVAYIEERLKKVEHELDSIQQRIQQYKSRRGAIDISVQGRLLLENVSSNDQKLSEVNTRLAILDQVERHVSNPNKFAEIVPSTLGVTDPILLTLINKLYESELEYENLRKTTGENNGVLVAVFDRIQKIKPSILENIQSQKRSLLASKSNLVSTNNLYSGLLQTIPTNERQLLEISRDKDIKTGIYNFLLQKREEAAISNSSISADGKLIDRAMATFAPVTPNKILIYFVFVVASFFIPAAFIFIRENLSSTIVFRNEIQNLTSFPIIGEIAFEKVKDRLLIENGKQSVIVEQFRKLRNSFNYLGVDMNRKRILITSNISGEGKSFIAVNLSLTLAQEGKRVVLLEADLNHPTITKMLGFVDEVGISNFLLGQVDQEEIIMKTKYSGLYVIGAGKFSENSSALFRNGRIEKLLQFLHNKFDFIIIDSAPAGLLSDAYILSPLCDATIYVVRHRYTPKAILKRLEENNQINELKNLAIVFNSVHGRGLNQRFYGYGYSYENMIATSINN